MTRTLNIAGRLHTIADDGVLISSDELLDERKNKKQNVVNADVDSALADRYTKSEVYTKQEVNNLVSHNQNYVTVAEFTDLPISGATDTIYRVSSWDGSLSTPAVDVTKYSEYAWDDTGYVFLCVKTQIGEVYDISAANSGAKYADLSAALGVDGGNVPSEIRRGGMSVKFVQSSDSKYVRYNLLADSFTTDVTQWAIDDVGVYVENPEFVYVKTDAEGKILWAIRTDGSIYYGAGVPQQVIDCIEEKIADLSDEYEDIFAFLNGLEEGDKTLQILLNEKADKEEGKSLIDAEYASTKSTIDNPEFIEVTTDSEGKLLAGRTPDGAAFEKVGLELGSAALKGMDDPEGRLEIETDAENKIISYRDKDRTKVEPILKVTEQLILGDNPLNDLMKALDAIGYTANNPTDWSKSDFIEIPMPDVCCIMNIGVDAQAEAKDLDIETHMQFWDKNGNYFHKPILLNAQGSSSMSFWIKNQAFDFADETMLKIGNWPAFDSFHIKKFYIDVFRGQCIAGYWLTEQVYRTRPYGQRRPWDYLNQETTTTSGIGKFKKDFDTGAMGHPDGFPVHLFFNGKDAGIYAFNIKKHRDNYYMDKNNSNNIHLDGAMRDAELFGGSIDFTSFEIRNPKGLKTVNGEKYDGDNPTEITGDPAVDSTTAAVKANLVRLSGVNAALAESRTKEVFETYFNVPFYIDYFLISQVIWNEDGFWKNWQWCTWDGRLWAPLLYDLDSIFGSTANGAAIVPAIDGVPLSTYVQAWTNTKCMPGVNNVSNTPTIALWNLYKDEIKVRYKQLRDAGIFTTENIIGLLEKWVKMCGYDNLKNDIEVVCAYDGVPQTPSYRDGEKEYTQNPTTGGCFNSIQRVSKWLDEHFAWLDGVDIFDYNHN